VATTGLFTDKATVRMNHFKIVFIAALGTRTTGGVTCFMKLKPA
jgi:hypothetical protein